MDFNDYIVFFQRRWPLLLFMPAAAILVAYIGTKQLTPTYQATATVLMINVAPVPEATATVVATPVGATPGTGTAAVTGAPAVDAPLLLNDILINEQLTNTYLLLATQRPVLELVIEDLSLNLSPEQLRTRLSVTNSRATQLLHITAEDSDAEVAAAIANSTVRSFIAETDRRIGRSGTVQVAEDAVPPPAPSAPNVKLNVALSGFLGVLLAAVFGLVLNTFDTTLRSTAAVEAATGISTISVISRATLRGRRWPLISITPTAGWAEDCRQLRTQLLSQKPTPRTVLVTSESRGEGKSFTASNLSIALALAGDSVILIDGDMRTPALNSVFDLPNDFGLSDALFTNDGSDPTTLLTQTSVPNLRVVVAGDAPGNPSDMLPSFKMLGLLEKLRPEADFIIFDSPSMSLVPDAGILARQVDATVLVVEANRTKHQDATLAVNQLRHSGGNLIGVVFNKSRNWRRGAIGRPAFLSGAFLKKPSVVVRR